MEKVGYNEVMDFRMSEKFGLDWKKYDNERVSYFMEIMAAESKRGQRDSRQNNKQNYGRHNHAGNH